ncbi:MAG: hypothetical protein PUB96_01790 [Helicobacteraceae bacterium]|nr:hypothetical protein [Helicobacteraceae bacterium]
MHYLVLKKHFLKFICAFVPFRKIRKKIRDNIDLRIFIDKDKMDSYIPKEVLQKIQNATNEAFILENRYLSLSLQSIKATLILTKTHKM